MTGLADRLAATRRSERLAHADEELAQFFARPAIEFYTVVGAQQDVGSMDAQAHARRLADVRGIEVGELRVHVAHVYEAYAVEDPVQREAQLIVHDEQRVAAQGNPAGRLRAHLVLAEAADGSAAASEEALALDQVLAAYATGQADAHRSGIHQPRFLLLLE